MFDDQDNLYLQTIAGLLQDGRMTTSQTILAVCGGAKDKEVFERFGFKHVTISNLDVRMNGSEYAPYRWSYQDAEALDFPDGSFDFCFVHMGLHHCFSPHRALLEMYRVARVGAVLIEPYDNLVTRLGLTLKVGLEFEHAAVFYNDCAFGGVKNTRIPNYVYRWTRREIRKAIRCFAPYAPVEVRFIHQFRIPWPQLRGRKNRLYYYAVVAAWPLFKVIETVWPQQCNCFAAVILKPDLHQGLYPWLALDSKETVVLNQGWLEQRYKR